MQENHTEQAQAKSQSEGMEQRGRPVESIVNRKDTEQYMDTGKDTER